MCQGMLHICTYMLLIEKVDGKAQTGQSEY